MKSKLKIKNHNIFITIKLPFKHKIDIKQNELLSQEYGYGFFKLLRAKRNKLEFSCPIGISLNERLKYPISKFDFFLIVEQFIDTIQKLKKASLSIDNLLLDLNLIYFNESAKELSFIYLPLVLPNKNVSIINFIKEIIYLVKPNDSSDSDYISKFSYYLKKNANIDVNKIEEYIYKENKEIVDLIKKDHDINNRDYKNKFGYDFEKNDLINSDYDDKTEIMVDECDELFSKGINFEIYNNNFDENTILMDDDKTEILEENNDDYETEMINEEVYFCNYPKLIRLTTNEVIEIDKPVFRIGKEEKCVDFVIKNNAAISRSHVDIIYRNGRYYVFDMRSKNKTYINNRVLPTEQEIEIFDGDILKLANEEFLFNGKDD